jgi:hypothetical protein
MGHKGGQHMTRTRTGARKYLDTIAEACRLYRMPYFQEGLHAILGPANATDVIENFSAFCLLVEGLILSDEWFNKVDTHAEQSGDEDLNIE